jgi:hypothetical protein
VQVGFAGEHGAGAIQRANDPAADRWRGANLVEKGRAGARRLAYDIEQVFEKIRHAAEWSGAVGAREGFGELRLGLKRGERGAWLGGREGLADAPVQFARGVGGSEGFPVAEGHGGWERARRARSWQSSDPRARGNEPSAATGRKLWRRRIP